MQGTVESLHQTFHLTFLCFYTDSDMSALLYFSTVRLRLESFLLFLLLSDSGLFPLILYFLTWVPYSVFLYSLTLIWAFFPFLCFYNTWLLLRLWFLYKWYIYSDSFMEDSAPPKNWLWHHDSYLDYMNFFIGVHNLHLSGFCVGVSLKWSVKYRHIIRSECDSCNQW